MLENAINVEQGIKVEHDKESNLLTRNLLVFCYVSQPLVFILGRSFLLCLNFFLKLIFIRILKKQTFMSNFTCMAPCKHKCASTFLILRKHCRISSVGRALVCRAGDRRLDPKPKKYSGS